MGVGRMWSKITGWGNAKDVLEQNGLDIIEYKPKEVGNMKLVVVCFIQFDLFL